METLRILTALEDLLGSLGPQVNIIMSRAITLENNKEGTANILLEDADVAAILQMTKEKLSGQIIAGVVFKFTKLIFLVWSFSKKWKLPKLGTCLINC